MAVNANAAEVFKAWSMITLCHTLAEAAAMHPIFNCYAGSVTEVNQTVVTAKFTNAKWVTIVAIMKLRSTNLKNRVGQVLHPEAKQQQLPNARALQKKVRVAET